MSFDYVDYSGIGGNRYDYNYNRGDNQKLVNVMVHLKTAIIN